MGAIILCGTHGSFKNSLTDTIISLLGSAYAKTPSAQETNSTFEDWRGEGRFFVNLDEVSKGSRSRSGFINWLKPLITVCEPCDYTRKGEKTARSAELYPGFLMTCNDFSSFPADPGDRRFCYIEMLADSKAKLERIFGGISGLNDAAGRYLAWRKDVRNIAALRRHLLEEYPVEEGFNLRAPVTEHSEVAEEAGGSNWSGDIEEAIDNGGLTEPLYITSLDVPTIWPDERTRPTHRLIGVAFKEAGYIKLGKKKADRLSTKVNGRWVLLSVWVESKEYYKKLDELKKADKRCGDEKLAEKLRKSVYFTLRQKIENSDDFPESDDALLD